MGSYPNNGESIGTMEHVIERGDVQGCLFKSRKQVMRKMPQQHHMIVFEFWGLGCGSVVWDLGSGIQSVRVLGLRTV